MKSPSNFESLVLGCMDSYDSNQILILQRFSRSTRLSHLFFPPPFFTDASPAEGEPPDGDPPQRPPGMSTEKLENRKACNNTFCTENAKRRAMTKRWRRVLPLFRNLSRKSTKFSQFSSQISLKRDQIWSEFQRLYRK